VQLVEAQSRQFEGQVKLQYNPSGVKVNPEAHVPHKVVLFGFGLRHPRM
jgi:hypothetical protein